MHQASIYHAETMDALVQQTTAIADGFARMARNQKTIIDNQIELIYGQARIARAQEMQNQLTAETNAKLDRLTAVTSVGFFASWRQTPEGRNYLAWEKGAKSILRISMQRDVFVSQLPKQLWNANSVPPRPAEFKQAEPIKEDFIKPPVEPNTYWEVMAGHALMLSAFTAAVAVVAFLIWYIGHLFNPALSFLPFFIWCLIVFVTLIVLAIVFKVSNSREVKRQNRIESQAADRAYNDAVQNYYDMKIESERLWVNWQTKYNAELKANGYKPDARVTWTSSADRQYLNSLVDTIQHSRERLPAPEDLPELRMPGFAARRGGNRVDDAILTFEKELNTAATS